MIDKVLSPVARLLVLRIHSHRLTAYAERMDVILVITNVADTFHADAMRLGKFLHKSPLCVPRNIHGNSAIQDELAAWGTTRPKHVCPHQVSRDAELVGNPVSLNTEATRHQRHNHATRLEELDQRMSPREDETGRSGHLGNVLVAVTLPQEDIPAGPLLERDLAFKKGLFRGGFWVCDVCDNKGKDGEEQKSMEQSIS